MLSRKFEGLDQVLSTSLFRSDSRLAIWPGLDMLQRAQDAAPLQKQNLASTMRKPFGLQTWRLDQGLHDHAILFRFLPQCAQLFRSGLRRRDIEAQTQTLEADRHVLCDTESAAKIEVSLDSDVDIFRWYSHGGRDHLAGN